jgi:hypothetical protein
VKRIGPFLVVTTLAWQAVACSGIGEGPTTPEPGTSGSAVRSDLPFTFFFTHYVMMGDDPMNPSRGPV